MRKRSIIPTVLILVLGMSGCQKDQVAPAAASKNEGQLKRVVSTPGSSAQTLQSEADWQEQLASENVTIKVNAVVKTPEVDTIPVVSCTPHYFTVDEVKNAINLFYGDAKLYDDSLSDKDWLETEIKKQKADLAYLKENGEYPEEKGDGWERVVEVPNLEEEITWLEDSIAQLEADYEIVSAGPIEVEQIELKENDYGGESIMLRDDQTPAMEFYAVNHVGDKIDAAMEYDVSGHSFTAGTPLPDAEQLDIAISREEAQLKALEAASACGVPECKVVQTGKTNVEGLSTYVFTLGRLLGGVPCIPVYEHEGTLSFGGDSQVFEEPWGQEKIQVMVNDQGVVGFFWEYPADILETVNSQSAVMSFDEIKEIARTILPLHFAENIPPVNQSDITVTISEVTLSMMRVKNTGTDEGYYYIPVWDFNGYYGENVDTNLTEDHPSATTSFLTLNAVDGSVIDRGLGY